MKHVLLKFFVIFFFSQQKQSPEVFRTFLRKIPAVESLFNKAGTIQAFNIIKERQLFFCEISENVKNTYVEEISKTLPRSQAVLCCFYHEKDCLS